jgi:hypothetical protein
MDNLCCLTCLRFYTKSCLQGFKTWIFVFTVTSQGWTGFIRDHVTNKGAILWNCKLLRLYIELTKEEWMNEWMCSVGGVLVTGKTWSTCGSTCSVTVCTPPVSHCLAWDTNDNHLSHGMSKQIFTDQYMEIALINSAFNADSELFHKIIIEGKMGWHVYNEIWKKCMYNSNLS